MSEFSEIAETAARQAGKLVRAYFGKQIEFEQKQDKTFASVADREAEEEIKRTILDRFPEHAVLGEESGKTGNSSVVWHVDPLDGTSNFKNGIPYCCTSIGMENNGKFVVGAIYNPFSGEMFCAEEGKGAYLNGRKIVVNSQPLSDGIIVIDASFGGKRGEIKANLQKDLIKSVSRFRMTGSNALQMAEVAKGTYVASISDALKSYDFAAGVVIAKEAGAMVSDQFGNEPAPDSKVIIMSNNKQTHGKLIMLAKNHYANY